MYLKTVAPLFFTQISHGMLFAIIIDSRHLGKKAKMKISVKTEHDRKTIKITDSVNTLDVPKLKQALSDAARFSRVTLDLTETAFICTGFINLLVDLKNKVPGAHERIRLLNPNNLILELLDLTDITKIIKTETYNDELKE